MDSVSSIPASPFSFFNHPKSRITNDNGQKMTVQRAGRRDGLWVWDLCDPYEFYIGRSWMRYVEQALCMHFEWIQWIHYIYIRT